MQTSNNDQIFIVPKNDGPGCLIQMLWFVFIGWWLGGVVMSVAWFLNVTIIGLPLGLALINNIPRALALQTPQTLVAVTADGTMTHIAESSLPQRNFFLRAVYFILIGWWWSGAWMSAAYFISATYILLPIGLSMFRLTPFMTTLKRY
ncbi:YccF domain-containing protein [Anaerolineales bacterium HSG24]|nr:YccF domain-containing protein [Anaerolineales bacterium HSG24]